MGKNISRGPTQVNQGNIFPTHVVHPGEQHRWTTDNRRNGFRSKNIHYFLYQVKGKLGNFILKN